MQGYPQRKSALFTEFKVDIEVSITLYINSVYMYNFIVHSVYKMPYKIKMKNFLYLHIL